MPFLKEGTLVFYPSKDFSVEDEAVLHNTGVKSCGSSSADLPYPFCDGSCPATQKFKLNSAN